MSPLHHPSADILSAYSSGVIEPGFGLVVGAHIEACAHCRARLHGLEAASGAALAALAASELAPDALTRTLDRLDAAPASAAPDRRALMQRLPLRPRKWVAPGVWAAAVDTPHAPQNRVYLLSVAPGAPTARHGHSGAEYCTVLRGAFRDETGHYFAGDFAATNAAFHHQPVIESSEACVCLFATEGRLKPEGLLGRIAFALADV